jgi:DNA-binding response OmpR family regulator
MQALVVAADPDEKEVLTFLMRRAGMAVASSSDYQRVLKNWADHPADLMIFAPGDDGDPVKILNEIRTTTNVPLLMILEKIPERVLCELLHNGADDILLRPVSPQLFVAHAHALSRRSSSFPSFMLPTLALEAIQLDPSTRSVAISGHDPTRLTQLEFRLLYTLMINRGQVVPGEVLVERVWGYTGEGNRDLVRGLVSRLRQKIDLTPEGTSWIETIPGVGYRFIGEDQ